MVLTADTFRADKRCGKSGIPDNAKCSKRTSAKSTKGPELKERAFAAATAVQGVRAARSALTGNRGRAVKQLLSAGKNASEYAQERGERTGNKKLLSFATGKNGIESAQAARSAKRAFQSGNLKAASLAASETFNTALESYSYNRQRQGKQLSNFEEQNRNFGDLLQASKWLSSAQKATARKPTMRFNPQTFSRSLRRQNKLNNARLMTEKMRRKYEPGYRNSKKPFWADGFEGELQAGMFRDDACWKGYVQKGMKRKGNRIVPNCVPTSKAKSEVKRKTGQDGEDKLTSAKRSVWAEGFPAKKTKARR